MAKVDLDDDETRVLLALADHYDNASQSILVSKLMADVHLDRDPLLRILHRFTRLKMGHSELLDETDWIIDPRLLDIADQIRHPPPRDYYNEVAVWFRSKRWSVPVLVLAGIVPAVYGWVSMILDIAKLFSDRQ